MNKRIMHMGVLAMLAMAGVSVAFAAESPGLQQTAVVITELDKLARQLNDQTEATVSLSRENLGAACGKRTSGGA